MSDSPPQTKTIKYVATAWTPDVAVPDDAKLIHFIRHGEGNALEARQPSVKGRDVLVVLLGIPGEHNRAFKASRSLEEYKNEAWADSRLTDVGVSTAKELQAQVRGIPVHAVYVSTLSRAIQTALHAFEEHDVPFISTELIRERIELEADFAPKVSFHMVEDGDDPYWSPDREPWADLVTRGNTFLDFVWVGGLCCLPLHRVVSASVNGNQECEHKAVSCVAHCDFFMGLFQMGNWDVRHPVPTSSFANCELRSVVLTKASPTPSSDA